MELHVENGNGHMDYSPQNLPKEGSAFSDDAPATMRGARFAITTA